MIHWLFGVQIILRGHRHVLSCQLDNLGLHEHNLYIVKNPAKNSIKQQVIETPDLLFRDILLNSADKDNISDLWNMDNSEQKLLKICKLFRFLTNKKAK